MTVQDQDPHPTELHAQARSLLEIVRAQARRPYIVELTGTPKAGKTTVIGELAKFFLACDYRVHVLSERAAVCPLRMKGHFFFNTWTTATMLAELLEHADGNEDIIIIDRGIFDALVWLELQFRRNQVLEPEREAFEDFVLLERWRGLVDLSVVLTVDPSTALRREGTHRGGMMNETSLAQFNDSLEVITSKFGDRFDLHRVSANEGTAAEVTQAAIATLLPSLRAAVDPAVTYVPRTTVEALFSGQPGFVPWSEAAWDTLVTGSSSDTRSVIEPRDEFVQLVGCGIAWDKRRIFVLQRDPEDEHHDAYGAGVIWQGIHVEQDAAHTKVSIERVRECVARRFKEDLHLALPIAAADVPIGFVWDPDARGGRHLGIAFGIDIPDADTAEHLEGKTFKTRGRRPPQTGRFVPVEDLRANADQHALETWSRAILASGWPTT
jgi:hypothetical protein